MNPTARPHGAASQRRLTPTPTQIYQVFIKASPEQIWTAITTPGYSARYFHGAATEEAGRARAAGELGRLIGCR